MEEKYLTSKEIIEVLSNPKYQKLLWEIQIAIGEQELLESISQKFNCDVKLITENNFSVSQHSGIWVKTTTNPILEETSDGEIAEFKAFRSKEEMIAFLDNLLEFKYSSLNLSRSQLKETTKENLKQQFKTLTDAQRESLIVYKSRMFQIMNVLWKIYKTADKCALDFVYSILNTDYTDSFANISNENIMSRKSQEHFKLVIQDIFAFFKKAKCNPKNDAFFSKIRHINFDNEKEFIKSLVGAMKTMESIDQITAPEDLKLFRGVYGKASLSKVSSSIMASCTPDLKIAIDFARDRSGMWSSYGDNSLITLNIAEGTPIIPMFFSVKTTIKGIGGDYDSCCEIKYDELDDDAIEIYIEKNGEIQDEIIINTQLCKIPNLDEWPEDKVDRMWVYRHLYADHNSIILTDRVTGKEIKDIDYYLQSFLRANFYLPNQASIFSSARFSCHVLYRDVLVDSLNKTNNCDTGVGVG